MFFSMYNKYKTVQEEGQILLPQNSDLAFVVFVAPVCRHMKKVKIIAYYTKNAP